MKLFGTIIFTLLFVSAQCQDMQEFNEKMKMETIQVKNYNWFYRNVSLDMKLGMEFFDIPEQRYDLAVYTTAPGFDYEMKSYEWGGFMTSLASLNLEPKITLFHFNRSTLNLKIPLTFGLSFIADDNTFGIRNKGGLNASIGGLIGVNTGLNSDNSLVRKKGNGISFGALFLKTPLFGGEEFLAVYYPEYGDTYTQRRNWFMPIIQYDHYFIRNTSKIQGYSITLSPAKHFYLRVAFILATSKK